MTFLKDSGVIFCQNEYQRFALEWKKYTKQKRIILLYPFNTCPNCSFFLNSPQLACQWNDVVPRFCRKLSVKIPSALIETRENNNLPQKAVHLQSHHLVTVFHSRAALPDCGIFIGIFSPSFPAARVSEQETDTFPGGKYLQRITGDSFPLSPA